MPKLLYPYIDSVVFSLYQDSIIKYSKNTEVIIFKDNPLETNTSYIKQLYNLKVKIHSIEGKDYLSFIQGLNLSQYLILPTHVDKYQQFFGYSNFDKEELYFQLNQHNVCTPKIYKEQSLKFPLIAKPKNGTGSNGVIKIDTPEEYKNFVQNKPNYFLDFGKGYQFEEFINGDTITVSFFKINNETKLLGAYDIKCESKSKFQFASLRHYPSQHSDCLNQISDKLLKFISSNISNGKIISFDVIKSQNNLYVIDVMNRLPLTELSKYVYSSFANNHVEYLLGNIKDPTVIIDNGNAGTDQILQKYFDFENCEILKYNDPIFTGILEFEPPKKIIKNVWNSKRKKDCGYIIIKSKKPIEDFDHTLKLMNIHFKEIPCIT